MNSTPNTNFDYNPLNIEKNEIRLVRIFHSRDKTAKIECELIHASLDDSSQPYEALSYTWDATPPSKSVVLSDRDFLIRENLEAALRALRQDEEDRCLWVDAICINQANVLERNREVSRMLKIYQNAQRVVVWLGPETDTTSLAIQHLQDLKHQREESEARRLSAQIFSLGVFLLSLSALLLRIVLKQLLQHWLDVLFLAWIYFGGYYKGLFHDRTVWVLLYSTFALWGTLLSLYRVFLGLPISFIWEIYAAAERQSQVTSPDKTTLAALKDVFERKWFTRVWVIQEVAAARDVIVICGSYELSWETLKHACWQLSYHTVGSWGRNAYTHTGFQRLNHIFDCLDKEDRHIGDSHLKGRSLFLLLCMFTICDATEKHDKVYGLLGLADEVQNPVPGVTPIEPRYDESPQRVYSMAAKFLIETSGNLRVFRGCGGSRSLDDLPSWVPDWSTKAWRDLYNFAEPYQLQTEDVTMAIAKFSDDLKTVELQGFIIGHLSGPLFVTSRRDSNEVRFGLRIFTPFIGLLFWVVQLLNTSGFLCLIIKVFSSRLGPELGMSLIELSEYYREVSQGHNLSKNLPRMSLVEDSNPIAFYDDFETKIFHLAPIPGLAILELGLCLSEIRDIRHGDTVCLLIGADTPMVLRKVFEKWILVGSAHSYLPEKFIWNKCLQMHAGKRLDLQSFIVI